MDKWIVADTETTGFSPKTDRLIQFGAAQFDPQTGELGETLHLYVNPGMPIPPAVQAIHGISDADVADKPRFEEVADQIADFLRGANVVAHQAPFDVGFLNAEFKRAKREEFEKLPNKIICTRRMARAVRPRDAATLDALCDVFGIDRTIRTFHGALVDCFLLAQVYPHLAKLQEAQNQVLTGLLPFVPGAELPEDLVWLGRAHVAIDDLMKRIEIEKKRVTEKIRVITAGKPFESEDFTVEFTPTTTTKWDQIKDKYLAGVDLAPFQKPGSKMTISSN
jgi:DNA polymerase-3 subunit epsilon